MSTVPFQAHCEVRQGHAAVALTGELDLDTAPRLWDAVRGCLAERPHELRIDFGGIAFCDCSGLNALLRAREAARTIGTDFRVDGVRAQPARLFAMAGVDGLLVRYGDERAPGPPGVGRPSAARPRLS